MKGKFIAKAFVILSNGEQFRDILRNEQIGHRYFGTIPYYPDLHIMSCSHLGLCNVRNRDAIALRNEAYIDCNLYANGDEDLAVKLFLALAEMDLNKPETLYYSVPNNLWGIQGQQVGGFIVKHCDIPKLHLTERHYIDKHNPIARPEELAEAVMRGDVKL